MDGEDMIRSYMQISQEEAKQMEASRQAKSMETMN